MARLVQNILASKSVLLLGLFFCGNIANAMQNTGKSGVKPAAKPKIGFLSRLAALCCVVPKPQQEQRTADHELRYLGGGISLAEQEPQQEADIVASALMERDGASQKSTARYKPVHEKCGRAGGAAEDRGALQSPRREGRKVPRLQPSHLTPEDVEALRNRCDQAERERLAGQLKSVRSQRAPERGTRARSQDAQQAEQDSQPLTNKEMLELIKENVDERVKRQNEALGKIERALKEQREHLARDIPIKRGER